MASAFGLDEFVGNSSVAELKEAKLTTNDLKYIAQTSNISFPSNTRKEEIGAFILTHFGDREPSPVHLKTQIFC